MVADILDMPGARLERILLKAREGDQDAFAEIVREHESMVYSIALHAVREMGVAEELAQDVFLQLYRSLGEIESAQHLIFWLRRVTANRCIDVLRRASRTRTRLDEIPEPFVHPCHEDPLLRGRLRNLVAELPDTQRLAIILRYQEEMEPAEISAALSVPVSTIKSHLYRALTALRSSLDIPSVPTAQPRATEERS